MGTGQMRAWVGALWGLVATGCMGQIGGDGKAEGADRTGSLPPPAASLFIPAYGTPSTLDVGTWNLEWFGSTSRGPRDEALQLDNAATLLGGLELDLVALQEVIRVSSFDALVGRLNGFDGIVASDDIVAGHRAYHGGEMKPAFLFRSSALTFVSAQVILRDEDFSFAGRPPLEATFVVNATGDTVHVINFHAKAGTAPADWTRRRDGALALESYLDAARAGDDVLILGDFNDDLDESISGPRPSPYASLVQGFFSPTFPLAQANQPTTTAGNEPVDHALLGGAWTADFVDGSAVVFDAERAIARYDETTSNHLPVLFRIATGAPPSAGVFINEILANEPGGATSAEFVELVNGGNAGVDVSGWTVSDAVRVRFALPPGTVIPAGASLVISAGAPALDGAWLAASSLGFSNGGDVVTIHDDDGDVVDAIDYPSSLASVDGVSMTRAVDGDPDADFVLHATVSASDASPGLTVDGVSF